MQYSTSEQNDFLQHKKKQHLNQITDIDWMVESNNEPLYGYS